MRVPGPLRKYASFFEWPDKGRKELGIVEELLRALDVEHSLGWHSPSAHRPDPPDCVCLTRNGERVAIEVAEVVCQTTTRLAAQGQRVMRDWRPGELRNQVVSLLAGKDSKTYHRGPYDQIVVCLHTDEPMVTPTEASAELCNAPFGPYRQISSAYLLFSYDPNIESYPVLTLPIA